MNNLCRNIGKGEKVVLKKEIFKTEYQALDQRTVEVLSGFGMSSFTAGTALFVRFPDGEKSRFDGSDISVEETNSLHE